MSFKVTSHQSRWPQRGVLVLILSLSELAFATTPQTILRTLEETVKQQNSQFQGFSSQEGRKIYEFVGMRNGEKISCSTCHTSDPRKSGQSKAGKEIRPLAPSVNAERFTDSGKVEKWFRRNCNDVFGRECTSKEKGDFITFLLSL